MKRLLLAACAALCLAGSACAADDLRDPTQFPVGGGTVSTRRVVNVGAASSVTVDSSAVGTSGVLRDLVVINTGLDTTTVLQLALVIRYDGSAVASDSFPVGALLGFDGCKHAMADTLHTYATPFWERRTVFATTTGTNGVNWHLRYPIPFTNGYSVRLVNLTSVTLSLWTMATRQTQLPSCWNRTYRFHVWRTDSTVAAAPLIVGTGTRKVWVNASTGQAHGTNTTVTANHVGWAIIGTAGGTPWSKELVLTGRTADTLFTVGTPDLDCIATAAQMSSPRLARPEVFWRRSAGKVGYVVSMVGSLLQATSSLDNLWLEACPRVYTDNANAGSDGQTPEIIGTGTEDWFGGVGYGFAGVGGALGVPGWLTGVTTYDEESTGGKLTAYRIFPQGLAYTNGGSATWTNWSTAATVRSVWTVSGYERN